MIAMDVQLVMAIIGPDQPGVVKRVSTAVSKHGGNWLESRMAHLAGQFAGILRVEVEAQRADALIRALQHLRADGLTVVVERTAAAVEAPAVQRIQLQLAGSDHPGIVHHITEVLAEHSVNIEELITEVSGTPMSGTPMFRASAELQAPATLELSDLRAALEAVAGDLMVDITLEPADDD